jgi:hypothetical protein
VVSTDIPEVSVLDDCRIGASHEHFLEEVAAALEQPGPQPAISERMRGESWEARLCDIEDHLREVTSRSAAVPRKEAV